MNKRQKAIAQAVPSRVMTATEFEYATDNYKEFRKSRKMTNTQFKEYRDTISEGKFSKSLIAKAIKIAKKSSGNMTAAFNAIEKLKKGLGDDPEVSDALRLANESKKEDDEENALLDKEALGEIKLRDIVKKEKESKYTSDTSKTVRMMTKQIKKDKGSDEVVIVKLSDDGDSVMQVPKADFLSKYKKKGYELVEAVLRDRDYTYDEKEGVVKISKKNFKKVHKDYKNPTKGKERMLVLTKKGTASVPVKFTEGVAHIIEAMKVNEIAMRVDPTVAHGNGQSAPSDYKRLMKNYRDSQNKKVYDILDKAGWRLGEQGQTLVTNMLKKHKGDVKKTAKDIMKKYPKMKKEEVELDELSRKTLGSYVSKASDSRGHKKLSTKKVDKRYAGVSKASKKLDKYNAVNLKKLKKEYEDNEDRNNHTENYLLLAKAFGSSSDVKKVQEIMKRNEKQGSTSKKDMDWMYKNINPYYSIIRNEGLTIKRFSQYLSEGVYDPKDGEKWAKEIQKGINAPVVQATTSTLGGVERMSIMVKFSLDKEAAKGGTAWHNSRHANVRVDIDGSMEMFQKGGTQIAGIKKMRKAKFKSAKDVIKKINDWIKKVPDLKEEVLAEAYKYKIDHKTYTSAVEEALLVAEKAKYEVDMDDYFNSIATGPRKPGEGKTNTFKIALSKGGKEQRKKLQIQIYGKGKHGYELNCYIA
jgi:hypothetical protein